MVRVLSVQSEGMGHGVYAQTLRRCFASFPDVELTSVWSREERSLPTRLLTRLLEQRLPLLHPHNLDLFRFRSEFAHGRMSRLLAERRLRAAQPPFDVLHFHTQVQALASGRLLGRLPTVISLDMTACQVAREPHRRFPATLLPNIRAEQRIFAQAAHLVTWSEWARQSLLTDYGLPPEQVTALSPGALLAGFPPPRPQLNPIPRLLFIGHQFVRKGGDELLQVFAEHFTHRAELHLVTNHTPPALPPGVFLHPGIRAYTPPWYRLLHQADLFVLPTASEAFGLVFQEAAAAGLALIGTRINAIPEMVQDGRNGLLVPPGDRDALRHAIATLLDDPARLLAMRAASRRLALEHFDAEKNFRRLADLFLTLAGKRDQGPSLAPRPSPLALNPEP